MTRSNTSGPLTTHYECRKAFSSFIRPSASYSTKASDQNPKQEGKDLSTTEHPFDDITYNIPEKPVTFTEGASYSLVILAGLGIAALAGYAVFKELIFEPKEYKIFGKALTRIQSDSQVTSRIGHPITGYGQETRNRAARQRIPSKIWTDEDGVEHVEVAYTLVSATVSASIVLNLHEYPVAKARKGHFTGYNCAVCCASFLGNCSGNSLVP